MSPASVAARSPALSMTVCAWPSAMMDRSPAGLRGRPRLWLRATEVAGSGAPPFTVFCLPCAALQEVERVGARRGGGGAGCAEGRAAEVLGALVSSGQTAGACLARRGCLEIGSRRREWPPAVHKRRSSPSAVVGVFKATSEGVLRISIQTGALLSSVMWPVQRCTGFVTPMGTTTDSYLQYIESTC